MNYQQARRESFKEQVRKAAPGDRFRTLKVRLGAGGRIVIATRRIAESNIYQMGVAYCAPGDSFNKLMGQSIALGRMLKNPVEFERSKDRPVKWSVAAIAVDIAQQRDIRWMEGITPEDLV